MTVGDIKDHTSLLNFLISEYGLTNYLEIGSQHKTNFNAIKLEEVVKICVDPEPTFEADFVMTSDEYFKDHVHLKYQLIFIDGDHTKEQVKKDFENALNSIMPLPHKAFIVLHDTNPTEEIWTQIPRVSKQWTGDVYRFACKLGEYDGINFTTFPSDYGVTVVWFEEYLYGEKITQEITWEYFQEHKAELLRFNNELPPVR